MAPAAVEQGGAASGYVWGLNSLPPPPASDLRAEVAGRPTVGDLIQPGHLVATNYGTGPYRVETVNSHEVYPGFTAWSLGLSTVRNGVVVKKDGWASISELVVEWEGDLPRFRKLFVVNDDEVLLQGGAAYGINRAGQLSLF